MDKAIRIAWGYPGVFFVVAFYLSIDKSQMITNSEQRFKVLNSLLCFK